MVENVFARLKHFRGIATRFDKLARNYKAMLRLACIFIWCKAKWEHALVYAKNQQDNLTDAQKNALYNIIKGLE